MAELKTRDTDFSKQVDLIYVKLVHWIVKMNSDVLLDESRKSTSLVQGMSTENRIQARTKLILRGLDLAVEIKQTMKTLFLLY